MIFDILILQKAIRKTIDNATLIEQRANNIDEKLLWNAIRYVLCDLNVNISYAILNEGLEDMKL